MTDEIITTETQAPLSLAALTQNTQIAPAGADDKDFEGLAKTRAFLPRITLMQATSKEVTKRKALSGEFVLTRGKEDIEKMSEAFIGVPLAFRFKAVDMRNKEKILNYFDQKSPAFLECKKISQSGPMTGCMAGIEFLFWLPEQDCFATWYANSITSLGEAQSVRSALGKSVSMKSNFIESKSHSWYGPKCVPSSEPIKEPDMALAQSTLETFINPKSSEVEVVTEGEAAADDRAR